LEIYICFYATISFLILHQKWCSSGSVFLSTVLVPASIHYWNKKQLARLWSVTRMFSCLLDCLVNICVMEQFLHMYTLVISRHPLAVLCIEGTQSTNITVWWQTCSILACCLRGLPLLVGDAFLPHIFYIVNVNVPILWFPTFLQ
jgi:uncharacterized membrane protein